MISTLKGIIVEKQPPLLLIEVLGIGYELHMPITCFHKLPDIGKETVIFTHLILKENSYLLFGFNNKQERSLFRRLIRTNGIGTNIALLILSRMSIKQFFNIINCNNVDELIKIPYVNKKIAERLIIEMKNQFNVSNLDNDSTVNSQSELSIKIFKEEAIAALISLGYKSKKARYVIDKVAKPNIDSKTMIREALRISIRE